MTARVRRPVRPGHATEAPAQAEIIAACRARGWRVQRVVAGKARGGKVRMAEDGHPDVAVFPGSGVVAFLEVKSSSGEPSDAQLGWAARERPRGYVVEFVRTADEALAAVERAIRGAK